MMVLMTLESVRVDHEETSDDIELVLKKLRFMSKEHLRNGYLGAMKKEELAHRKKTFGQPAISHTVILYLPTASYFNLCHHLLYHYHAKGCCFIYNQFGEWVLLLKGLYIFKGDSLGGGMVLPWCNYCVWLLFRSEII